MLLGPKQGEQDLGESALAKKINEERRGKEMTH